MMRKSEMYACMHVCMYVHEIYVFIGVCMYVRDYMSVERAKWRERGGEMEGEREDSRREGGTERDMILFDCSTLMCVCGEIEREIKAGRQGGREAGRERGRGGGREGGGESMSESDRQSPRFLLHQQRPGRGVPEQGPHDAARELV